MKPNERKLERLIKRITQGEELPSDELLFHWQSLGDIADRIVIRSLNRANGWQTFGKWGIRHRDVQTKLESLVEKAGMTEAAVDALKVAGVSVSETDSPRLRAWWIRDVIANANREEWDRARLMMTRDSALFEGSLDLIENMPESSGAEFITTLSEARLEPEQDQQVRKSLYRLRQKGMEPPVRGATAFTEKEIFVFGHNRVPLFQPVLYSRASSVFSDRGDLQVINIEEGDDFKILVKGSAATGRHALQEIGDRYSKSLEEEMGIKIPFQTIEASHARYFLHRSFVLMQDGEAKSQFENLVKTMGEGSMEDPLEAFRSAEQPQTLDAGIPSVFDAPYFSMWYLKRETAQTFLKESDVLESGPIILPESQVRDRKRALSVTTLRNFFDERNRAIWSFAFEKACWFLMKSDAETSRLCWSISQALMNPEKEVEDIPAVIQLFERTVESARAQRELEQKEEKRGSVIMSPQEFERQRRKRP